MNMIVNASALASASKVLADNVDPVFAAIDAHKIATARVAETSSVYNDLDAKQLAGDDSVIAEHRAAYAASQNACEAQDEAAVALSDVTPTTIKGTIALLQYVDDFNRGKFGHYQGRQSCFTEHYQWPHELVSDEVKDHRGRELPLPYPYWIMMNVQRALQTFAA